VKGREWAPQAHGPSAQNFLPVKRYFFVATVETVSKVVLFKVWEHKQRDYKSNSSFVSAQDDEIFAFETAPTENIFSWGCKQPDGFYKKGVLR